MAVLQDILSLLDRWDQWKRIKSAPDKIEVLERRIAALEAKAPKTAGKPCPACGEPAMRRTGTEPDPMFGDMGVNRETWTCGSCGETDLVQKAM
ncbi:MAG TPA: hypothetical protein VF503_08965 [Sphingobium sp.]|uniref:hypothetical protein n=1 Tax=Sphingobium sp. TaxID=1912891 RepID=UPI002ED4593A